MELIRVFTVAAMLAALFVFANSVAAGIIGSSLNLIIFNSGRRVEDNYPTIGCVSIPEGKISC
jgi:hypothetical protein